MADDLTKSVMVYCDENYPRIVLCTAGQPKGPAPFEPCNNGAPHTHSWVTRGWITLMAFYERCSEPMGSVAQKFVFETMMSVVAIRDRYESMERERSAAVNEAFMLRAKVSHLNSLLESAIAWIPTEENRLHFLKERTKIMKDEK